MAESSSQIWIAIAFLMVVGILIFWGVIRVIAGIRSLRRSEKAFFDDLRPPGAGGKKDQSSS